MITSADVVVIGSGAFGASAAYLRATPSLTRLARRAVAKLASFTDETGQPLRFTQSGALKIARNERDAEQLSREVARGAAAGVEIDFVSIAEAQRRLPILGARGIAAITWSPTDCNVEPSELLIGYCRAAEKLGAALLPHTPATGFEIGAGGVEGVRTPHGTIGTRAVLDAAGGWARLVAAGLGSALPVVPTRHQLLITEPIAGVGPEFPIARVIDANVYVRHERGGLMLGGYEPDPLQVDMAALPPAFDIAELPLDIEVLWRLARSVSEQFPIFQDPTIRVAEHRLRGRPQRLPRPRGGDGRVDPRRGAVARSHRDLNGALRRTRSRRGRAARAMPAGLRGPLPGGQRDVGGLVNHLIGLLRCGMLTRGGHS